LQFFEITTTVDPSYIISLIRKLIPIDSVTSRDSRGVNGSDDGGRGDTNQMVEESGNECEKMDIVNDGSRGGEDKDTCRGLAGDEVWEEYGCVLWDLAASRTHAELMVLIDFALLLLLLVFCVVYLMIVLNFRVVMAMNSCS
jgi:hypothetical protein